jgi:hypothetical protein
VDRRPGRRPKQSVTYGVPCVARGPLVISGVVSECRSAVAVAVRGWVLGSPAWRSGPRSPASVPEGFSRGQKKTRQKHSAWTLSGHEGESTWCGRLCRTAALSVVVSVQVTLSLPFGSLLGAASFSQGALPDALSSSSSLQIPPHEGRSMSKGVVCTSFT